jgi:hypothetical protein
MQYVSIHLRLSESRKLLLQSMRYFQFCRFVDKSEVILDKIVGIEKQIMPFYH